MRLCPQSCGRLQRSAGRSMKSPAKRTEHFPIVELLQRNRPTTSGPIALEQLFARTETTCGTIDGPEAPADGAEPAEVTHRIAAAGQFPIEHHADPVAANDQVASTKVTMHDGRCRGVRRRSLGEPAERDFEHRTRLAIAMVGFAQLGEFLAGGCTRQRRQVIWPQCVDASQDRAHLQRQLLRAAANSSLRSSLRAMVSPAI